MSQPIQTPQLPVGNQYLWSLIKVRIDYFPPGSDRVTEDGSQRITEDSDDRITE